MAFAAEGVLPPGLGAGPPPAPGVARSSSTSSSFRALAGGSTPLDGAQASAYLAQAYRAVTGSAPSPRTLDLLWAQWALETARGQAMVGNNFGGIKAGRGGAGALLVTHEGYGDTRHTIRDRFRTYATPEEGARDYVSLLSRKYPDAFAAARAGDLDGFARGLARAHYFTAHPDTYRAGLAALSEEHRSGAVGATPAPLRALALDGLRWAIDRASERE